MRMACFAVTSQALALARTLQRGLDEPLDIYVSRSLVGTEDNSSASNIHAFDKLSTAVAASFHAYDGLVFVMAAGIVVRLLAPHLENKLTDPAVVVFDEQGQHGISLLSGHIGGANELTRQLCQVIGAGPVITTATDVNGCLAPDVLARRLALRPWPKVRIKPLNAAVLAGETIRWRIDRTLPHSVYYRRELEQAGQLVELCTRNQLLVPDAVAAAQPMAVIVDEQQLPALADLPADVLCLSPRRLIAGVGCRRGTPAALVMQALDMACQLIGRDRSFLDVLASTTVKRHEAGLLYTADSLGRPVCFYENEEMQQQIDQHQLDESAFVHETIGIGNVCEAAAYCCAGERGGRLALRKTKFEKVTVALLWEK